MTDHEKYKRVLALQRDARDQRRPFQPHRLKQARQVRGLSKGELMIACGGLPVGSYEAETGLVPSLEQLARIAQTLQFPIAFFTNPPQGDEPSGWFTHLDGMGCPCGIDDCGYWAPWGGDELEPCRYGGKPPPCEWCDRTATHLCDMKSCDAPICAHHRKRTGPTADVCPRHSISVW